MPDYQLDNACEFQTDDDSYGGVISCGRFTQGLVGPGYLPALLRVTWSGGLIVCGTIASMLDGIGFAPALARLQAGGPITQRKFAEDPIYDNPDHPRSMDTCLVMESRKC